MKDYLVKVLSCPVCLDSPLQLKISGQKNREVIDGILLCLSCGRKYPIEEKIPRMIPEDNENIIKKKAWQESTKATKGKEEMKKHFEVRQANIAYHDVAANTYEMDVIQSVHQNRFNQERIEGIIRDLSK